MPPAKEQIHTAWCDYFATGEGRRLMAFAMYARDERHMRELLRQHYAEFWSVCAKVESGVIRNEVTQTLWTESVFKFIERAAGDAGTVLAKSELHVNFS